MATVKAILNSRIKRDGTQLILVKVDGKFNGKRYRPSESTGLSVEAKHFNPNPKNFNYIKTSHERYAFINGEIYKKINAINDKLFKGEANVSNIFDKVRVNDGSFKFFALEYLANYNGKFSSWKTRKSQLNTLWQFLGDRESDLYNHFKEFELRKERGQKASLVEKLIDYDPLENDLLFSDLTYGFLKEYENHLVSNGLKVNTIGAKIKGIRALLYEAFRRDETEIKNPFNKYKIKNEKVIKNRLTLEQVSKIIAVDLPKDNYVYHARNAFVLGVYLQGMRVSDVLFLRFTDLDSEVLRYSMIKTGKSMSVGIPEEAFKIIKEYKETATHYDDYVLPFLRPYYNDFKDVPEDELKLNKDFYNAISDKTALINKGLKQISKICDIDFSLSTHIARHSFASIARNNLKGDIQTVKELLGHDSIATTEKYLGDIPEETLHKVNKAIFSKTLE